MADKQHIEPGRGKVLLEFVLARAEVHSCECSSRFKFQATKVVRSRLGKRSALLPRVDLKQSRTAIPLPAHVSKLAAKQKTAGLTDSSGRRLDFLSRCDASDYV